MGRGEDGRKEREGGRDGWRWVKEREGERAGGSQKWEEEENEMDREQTFSRRPS